MDTKSIKKILILLLCFTFLGMVNFVVASEKIIQEEKMSFERCLKVIEVSEDKLSITPEVVNGSEKKRSAIFTLTDGFLTITCDGEKGLVTVSTRMN